MVRTTGIVRLYKEDIELLKRMNGRSIAEGVNIILNRLHNEDLRDLVKEYMERVVMPYVQEKMSEIQSKGQ